jgi:hypothetical protein
MELRNTMRLILSITFLILGATQLLPAQHLGIVRKNYFSTYFDTILNMNIEVYDSSTIRLGSIEPTTGVVSNIGTNEYNLPINLTGATINPYANHYIIASGSNLLTLNIANGNIVHYVPITGPVPTFAFQNFRFNPSDTTIYGLVPVNFFSSYFDSLSMTTIQVLDSSHIRFAFINPSTGQYNLLGNTPLKNVHTLAGNAINPHQMLFYYSAVDTLVSIDLYTGNVYNEVPIQVPTNAMFENFTYSCADSAIYGIVRQNYISTVYDSILMIYLDVIDSTTFLLGKINPVNGQVNIISPYNLGLGATLNGSCFIDPDSMMYYFSSGINVVGVSLLTGQITSIVPKTYAANYMYFDMMRSTKNCFGALKVRIQQPSAIDDVLNQRELALVPNPASDRVEIKSMQAIRSASIYSVSGQRILETNKTSFDISSIGAGLYWVRIELKDGGMKVLKFVKQ